MRRSVAGGQVCGKVNPGGTEQKKRRAWVHAANEGGKSGEEVVVAGGRGTGGGIKSCCRGPTVVARL